jgi:hypothetical protein
MSVEKPDGLPMMPLHLNGRERGLCLRSHAFNLLQDRGER